MNLALKLRFETAYVQYSVAIRGTLYFFLEKLASVILRLLSAGIKFVPWAKVSADFWLSSARQAFRSRYYAPEPIDPFKAMAFRPESVEDNGKWREVNL